MLISVGLDDRSSVSTDELKVPFPVARALIVEEFRDR